MIVFVNERLQQAISAVPAGAWVVGVSGGADSTALLRLLHARRDLQLVIAHLHHETRGDASDADEQFVNDLARSLKLPFESRRISELPLQPQAPANPSAYYRYARFVHFREVVRRRGARGVVLAHHSMDQAETVFQRLIRGSAYAGLKGIAARAIVMDVPVHRPLLRVHPILLREFLRSLGQTWRVDESNESNKYGRNRIRKLLNLFPSVCTDLDDLRHSCRLLHTWVQATAPHLPERFPAKQLARLPLLLARQSAARWLIAAGCMQEQVESNVADRLVRMARDASTPPRQSFPGGVSVHRKAGWIDIA